jgi:hypothetical protein
VTWELVGQVVTLALCAGVPVILTVLVGIERIVRAPRTSVVTNTILGGEIDDGEQQTKH